MQWRYHGQHAQAHAWRVYDWFMGLHVRAIEFAGLLITANHMVCKYVGTKLINIDKETKHTPCT